MRAALFVLLVPHLASAEAPPPARLWTEGSRAPLPTTLGPQVFVRLVRAVSPAVVDLSTTQVTDGGRTRTRGQGAGFVVEPSGYLLTNAHVVAGADSIRARFADGREATARTVGRDERTDLAVLKVDLARPLPVVPLGDSDKLAIGEWVVAVGCPFGLEHSVTAGIVSAKGRRELRASSTPMYADFIQTDASINVGNSGGPLFNLRGEVIGINTAINPQGQGIGFAIPINMAKALVPELVARGRIRRPWLGLYPQPITPLLARSFGLDGTAGALIAEVVPGSPAADAGLRPGDVVVELGGAPIRRADDLPWRVALSPAGRPVEALIVRERRRLKLLLTLVEPPQEAEAEGPLREQVKPTALGIVASEITEGLARELGQPGLRGVVITQVELGSPAAEMGLERGDVVLRAGEQQVTSLDDYAAGTRDLKRGDTVRLLVRRDKRNRWVAFEKR